MSDEAPAGPEYLELDSALVQNLAAATLKADKIEWGWRALTPADRGWLVGKPALLDVRILEHADADGMWQPGDRANLRVATMLVRLVQYGVVEFLGIVGHGRHQGEESVRRWITYQFRRVADS